MRFQALRHFVTSGNFSSVRGSIKLRFVAESRQQELKYTGRDLQTSLTISPDMEYHFIVVVLALLVTIVRSQRSYDPWGGWSKCSVTCDVGIRERQRRCTDGLCTQQERQSCVKAPCAGTSGSPQANGFLDWSEWSTCSKTCGDGAQERQRKCVKGGCIQAARRSCRLRTCPEDIEGWSQWTSCSVTCGQGVSTRQRRCATGSCIEKQTKTCHIMPCGTTKNVTIEFHPWQEWSECSATCGPGERRRIRECRSRTCQETAVQTCSIKPCEEPDLTLGDWQSWGKCSVTCGIGIRKRKRYCVVGFCEQTQTASCRLDPCTNDTGEYEEWQAWEPCSVTCGVGEHKRVRRCVVGLCQQVMRKTCFAPTCPGPPVDIYLPWRPWSVCTVPCGGGERRRSRLCKIPANCIQNQAQSCNILPCEDDPNDKGFGDWSEWSQCSASCGSGESRRQRTNVKTGKTTDQLKQCMIEECEADDKYRNWGEWSGCSVTCGVGIFTRVRKCRAGSCEDAETKPCTLDDCNPIDLNEKYGEWLSWSDCSQTCGFGFARRERYCRIGDCKQTSSKTCRLKACPTDYTQWEDWGDCSVTCGSGITIRKRYCTVGVCEETQRTPCKQPICATLWEDWSDWEGCHKSCGGGFDYRKRRCKEPLPSVQCPGDDYNYRRCNTEPCITGTWGKWSDWGDCSKTCGTGVSKRTRVCDTDECGGDDEETRNCNTDACVQARWSKWSVWSDCTVTCGNGEKARTRTCIDGKHWDKGCYGSTLHKTHCKQPPCETAQWSKWSPWRPCSASCGEGTINRERVCIPKTATCNGPSIETNKCEIVACSADGGWTNWSAWSSCSTTCGKGTSTRLRTCKVGSVCDGESEEKKKCDNVDHSAPKKSWEQWSQWTQCSVTCGLGTIQRERKCLSCPENCQGQAKQVGTCQKEDCSKAEWGEWMSWSKCSESCGGGVTSRIRECVGGAAGDEGCKDGGREAKSCADVPCDEKDSAAKWSLWETWSSCTVTCGFGIQSRSRICNQPGSCDGDSEEASVCDLKPCPTAQVIPGVAEINNKVARTLKSEVAAGGVPWHVLMYFDETKVITKGNNGKSASGSLINNKWVLTSAHVFGDSQLKDPTSIVLLLGVTEEISSADSVPSHAQFYKAGQIVHHPKFNTRTYDYDLSLVKAGARLVVSGGVLVPDALNQGGTFQFDSYVRPIALPCISSCDEARDTTQNGIKISSYNRIRCLKYGRKFKSVTTSTVMVGGYSAAKAGDPRKLELHTSTQLKSPKCREVMQKVRKVHKRARFTGRNVCTNKNAPPQPCSGSSGDPLMKQMQGTDSDRCWVLLGVVTWNWGCTTSNAQYYANVPDLISWISRSMV